MNLGGNLKCKLTASSEKITVVIPWIALQELDGLKTRESVGKAARKAIDYLLVSDRNPLF